MFPILDARGRLVSFGGRAMNPDDRAKYLNGPESPLFHKGATLYGLPEARRILGAESKSTQAVIVVEGYMDVIALDRAGIAEGVAPNGTALTEAQLERMWRLEAAPILCFDGDAAGQKALVRAAQRALPHLGPERTLRFVALPAGQDPDDIVKTGGRAAIEELLAAAEPLVERLWRHERDSAPLDTPEARAGLKQRLLDHAATIGDSSLKQLYRDEWLQRFDAHVRPQRGGATGGGGFTARIPWKKNKEGRFVPPPAPASAAAHSIATSGTDRATARALVLGHALFPAAISDHLEALAALPIPDKAAATVRDRLLDLAMAGEVLDRARLATILQASDTAAAWRDVSKGGDIGFSFTRSDCDATIARRDLGSAIEALAATAEIEAALIAATARLVAGDDRAFEEQQRLHASREAFNQRLANLAGNE
jgi:DNA primase